MSFSPYPHVPPSSPKPASPPILRRADPHQLFESLAEVKRIRIANLLADLLNRQIRIQQQLLGGNHPQFGQIFDWGLTIVVLLEHLGQIGGGKAHVADYC